MNGVLLAGTAITVAGIAGYVAGALGAQFLGRAFTVTAIMVGISLLAIGNAGGADP